MAISKKTLAKLKPKDKEYSIADEDGLNLRVRPSGVMTWFFRSQHLGKPYRITIGHYNQKHPEAGFTQDQAKEVARRLNGIQERGQDPRQVLKREKEEAKHQQLRLEHTFAKLVEEFDRKVLSQRVRPEAARRLLNRDILPSLGHRPADEITRKEILTLLDQVVERKHSHTLRPGAPKTANRLLSLLKQIFKFASQREWVPFNPLTDVTREAVGGRERARDRALNETEIRTLLASMPEWRSDPQNIRFIRFMLGSGQRIATCAGALWEEFDLEKGIWNIPPSSDTRATKTTSTNNRQLPLSSYLLDILREQYRHSGVTRYVWPPLRSTSYDRPFNYQSINLLLRSNNHGGVNHFTPHDLRRTMITRMADLGIAPHIPEKICGHVLSGMLRVYNHSEYYIDQKKALEAWGIYLKKLEATKKH